MNRRGFFGSLASVAATAAFDPERLLWVRGQKLISIPRPQPLFRLKIGDSIMIRRPPRFVARDGELILEMERDQLAIFTGPQSPLRFLSVFAPPR